MTAAKWAITTLGGSVLVTALIGMTLQPGTAPAPLTPEQQHANAVVSAIAICKQWTTDQSRFAVDRFTDEYEVEGARPGHVLVGTTYRTQGLGLLAKSQCDIAESKRGPTMAAKAWLVR